MPNALTLPPMLVRAFFALGLLSGCVTTNTLRSVQLVKLDGYDARAENQPSRVLETVAGKKLEYIRGDVLEFEMRNGTPMKGQLQRLEFDPRHGVLHLALADGRNAYLDSSSPADARLTSFSPWKTVLLVACIITGAATATFGVAGIVLIGGRGFGGLGAP